VIRGKRGWGESLVGVPRICAELPYWTAYQGCRKHCVGGTRAGWPELFWSRIRSTKKLETCGSLGTEARIKGLVTSDKPLSLEDEDFLKQSLLDISTLLSRVLNRSTTRYCTKCPPVSRELWSGRKMASPSICLTRPLPKRMRFGLPALLMSTRCQKRRRTGLQLRSIAPPGIYSTSTLRRFGSYGPTARWSRRVCNRSCKLLRLRSTETDLHRRLLESSLLRRQHCWPTSHRVGSCADCPKRAGHNKLLFSDDLGKHGDQCTDRGCYQSKVSAQVAKTIAAKPQPVQISTAYGTQREGSPVLPRNKYTAILCHYNGACLIMDCDVPCMSGLGRKIEWLIFARESGSLSARVSKIPESH